MNIVWYLGLFAAVLLCFIMVAVLFGVEPQNLHIAVPVTIDLVDGGDEHEFIPFEDRPVLTVVKGIAKANIAPAGREGNLAMTGTAGIFLALFLWGIYLLRQVFRTLRKENHLTKPIRDEYELSDGY